MRFAAIVLALLAILPCAAAEDTPPKFLVIVVDGLRPDYITPDVMPTLYKLGQEGVFFENHHSVVPTVTRVNSASFSTGSYPETHGLMGNTVYFPKVNPDKALSTSDYANLAKIAEAEGGRLLTATTLAEALTAAGKKFVAVSSGSTGSAFLLNSTVSGGGVIHPDLILPESQAAHVRQVVGPAPAEEMPATAMMAWAVDAYIKIAREEMNADVAFLWLTDPDHTAHSKGMGAPLTLESLHAVDAQIARILDAHERLGLSHSINLMITSDHGFSTHIGGFNLLATLTKNHLEEGVHVAEGSIHVDNHDKDHIERIVEALQRDPAVGPIFTPAAESNPREGSIPGTLPMTAIHWQHARSADIVVFPAWDDQKNDAGFPGRTTYGGVAGHGSTSPFDIHNTLIAFGPSFKTELRDTVPSANSDLAPTVLQVLAIPAPSSMTGRPLREALAGGPDPSSVPIAPVAYSVSRALKDAGGRGFMYRCNVEGTTVEGRQYVNQVNATR
jgi:predicted AlkP superfamily pyrophosphatase or phosphodiesterase